MLIAVAAFVGLAIDRGHRRPGAGGASPPPASTSPSAPLALRQYTVFNTDQFGPRLAPLDGSPPSTLMPAGPGVLDRPVQVAGGVTFINHGFAYFLSTPVHAPPQALIPADHLFPMVWPGLVGVQRGVGPGPVSVQFVATTAATGSNSPVWQLPAGYQPVAQAGNGLLVHQHSGELRTWSLSGGQLGPIFGRAASVVDTHVDEVAWRDAVGCQSGECPLHITDASTGTDHVVAPLPGHHGFLDGGAFSPAGGQLAAFVSAAITTSHHAELVVIDVGTSIINTVGKGAVQIGEPVGAATWTLDATTVFFSGNNGTMLAYRPGDPQAFTTTIPASYDFVVW